MSAIAQFQAKNAQETALLAARLSALCRPGDSVLLSGELGAGKTTFARGFIKRLCPDAGEIVSPTFTLVQSYRSVTGAAVHHFDLYRLQRPAEVIELGLQEAMAGGICLVEWPAMAQDYMPADALRVDIDFAARPDERCITYSSTDASWKKRIMEAAA